MTPMTKSSYRTSNFYLAAFLHSKEIELIDIDRTGGSRRVAFVFAESTERERNVHAFNFSPEGGDAAKIDARKLISSIKALKEKLYQD